MSLGKLLEKKSIFHIWLYEKNTYFSLWPTEKKCQEQVLDFAQGKYIFYTFMETEHGIQCIWERRKKDFAVSV